MTMEDIFLPRAIVVPLCSPIKLFKRFIIFPNCGVFVYKKLIVSLAGSKQSNPTQPMSKMELKYLDRVGLRLDNYNRTSVWLALHAGLQQPI